MFACANSMLSIEVYETSSVLVVVVGGGTTPIANSAASSGRGETF